MKKELGFIFFFDIFTIIIHEQNVRERKFCQERIYLKNKIEMLMPEKYG